MALDLSADSLIRAASGLLFLGAGIAMWVVARGARQGRALGAYFAAFGAPFIVYNLGYRDPTLAPVTLSIFVGFAVLLVPLAVWASWTLAGEDSKSRRIVLQTYAAATLVAIPFTFQAVGIDPASLAAAEGVPAQIGPALRVAMIANAIFGTIALAFPVIPAILACQRLDDARSLRAASALSLSVGLFYAFTAGLSTIHPPFIELYGPLSLAGSLAVALAPGVAWLFAARGPHGRVGRDTALVVFGAALAGMVIGATLGYEDPWGTLGIVRTLGWAALAIGIMRFGLLGVDLDHRERRRGSMTALGLGTLFIVAQIVENLLDARYGLIVGGITAGAFLFAAAPVQRFFEAATSVRSTLAQPHGNDELYVEAVRLALRDRSLSVQEERHLTRLAHRLGIHAERAIELRERVERERQSR